MTLTSEDCALIEQIARKAVNEALQRKRARSTSSHTKAHEIREFILDNLDELQREFGTNEPFDIAVLRHWITKRITLKPRDMEEISGGAPRLHSQIHNALTVNGWPGGNAPIQAASKRGHYILRDRDIFTDEFI